MIRSYVGLEKSLILIVDQNYNYFLMKCIVFSKSTLRFTLGHVPLQHNIVSYKKDHTKKQTSKNTSYTQQKNSQEKVENLIKQLVKMSVNNPQYALSYYKAVKLDSDGQSIYRQKGE
jgi:hypothetical protein